MANSVVRTIVYYVAKALCLTALKLHNRFKVIGLEKIPPERPIIVACNHTSNLDPLVLGCAFPDRIRPLGKIELFQIHPLFTWLITTMGCLPVSRESDVAAATALKNFLALLKNGENLMIFPEGSRSYDGRLQPIEGGVCVLSTSTGAPIVPAYISGTYEAMPRDAMWIKMSRITVRWGNAIWPLPKEQRGTLKEERERIRTVLQNELARLEKESIG